MKRTDNGNPLERMFQRFAKFAEGGPTVPWLPQDANLSALRRTVTRLRAGDMKTPPGVDPQAAAWVIDRAIEQQTVVDETIADMDAVPGDGGSRRERDRYLRQRAAFHRLKIAARDPDSAAAEKFRQKNRARRRELGRPGRRKGDESESALQRRRRIEVPLTFVVGNVQQVFWEPYATHVAETLDAWFPAHFRRSPDDEPWCSSPVEWRGWSDLQQCAVSLLGEESLPHLLNTDAEKGVYLPGEVEACGLAHIGGDPSVLDVGAVPSLVEELERFARRRVLPTDEAALLELPDKVDDRDLALLTYAQVLRAARCAMRARLPMWVVKNTWSE